MKCNKYNIVQDYKGKKLLYNALNTLLVEIENLMFNSIFELMEFDKYPEEVNALLEKGFHKGTMSQDQDTANVLVQHLLSNWNGKHLGFTWFGGEPLMDTYIISYVSEKMSDEGWSFLLKL